VPGDDGAVYIVLVDLSGEGMRRTLAKGAPHLCCQVKLTMQMDRLSQCGWKLFRKFRRNIYHWSVNEDGPPAPLDLSGIERNRIPQGTGAHTAVRFRAGKLRPQFF